MNKNNKEIVKIYESKILNENRSLASLVQDTLEWLLSIEDFEEAEDSCNLELDFIGGGVESVVYSDNGVIIKLNTRPKEEWEKYIKLPCFCETELYEAEFGLVILQEFLTIDESRSHEDSVQFEIEECLKASGLPYIKDEISDENVGMNKNGEWRLHDLPL